MVVVRSVDRKADIYAASVVLWEALTGRRLEVEAQVISVVGPQGTRRLRHFVSRSSLGPYPLRGGRIGFSVVRQRDHVGKRD